MAQKCVITGGSGLIGSHLLNNLPLGWQAFALGRNDNKPTVAGPIHPITLDLAADWDSAVLPDRVDAVIHLAQSEHFREFPERVEDVFQVNTLSTLRLLDYARRAGARTFILASSGGVYGYGERAFTEEAEISAQSDLGFYLSSKLCAEVVAQNYVSLMNVIRLRFFFVYGAGQRRTMLIPRLITSIREGRPLSLQGEDGIRLNPTHVTDAVHAIKQALELRGSHIINIAGPEMLSLRQMGEIIGRVVDRTPLFEVQPNVAPRHLVGDLQKMTRLVGEPKIRFEQGVRLFLAAEEGQ